MNKKGSSVSDVILVIVFLLAFGITSVLAYLVYNGFNDDYQARDEISDTSKAMIQDNKDKYVGVFDGIVLLSVIGLTIALLIGASMIQTHPAFFIVALVVTSVAVLLAAVYSNVYEEFASDTTISAVESEFTILPVVMDKLPIIVTVIALLVALVLYSRTRGGEL